MIYVVQLGHLPYVKVGYAFDPNKRVADLSVSSPLPVRLLATREGDRDDERRAHIRLRRWRLRGEWFGTCPPLVDHLREIFETEIKIVESIDPRSVRMCDLLSKKQELAGLKDEIRQARKELKVIRREVLRFSRDRARAKGWLERNEWRVRLARESDIAFSPFSEGHTLSLTPPYEARCDEPLRWSTSSQLPDNITSDQLERRVAEKLEQHRRFTGMFDAMFDGTEESP